MDAFFSYIIKYPGDFDEILNEFKIVYRLWIFRCMPKGESFLGVRRGREGQKDKKRGRKWL